MTGQITIALNRPCVSRFANILLGPVSINSRLLVSADWCGEFVLRSKQSLAAIKAIEDVLVLSRRFKDELAQPRGLQLPISEGSPGTLPHSTTPPSRSATRWKWMADLSFFRSIRKRSPLRVKPGLIPRRMPKEVRRGSH